MSLYTTWKMLHSFSRTKFVRQKEGLIKQYYVLKMNRTLIRYNPRIKPKLGGV